MPQIKQVSDFINSIAKQAYGDGAVTATDLTGLIAMGNSVLSSATNTDAFLNVLIDRVGRVIISMRAYNGDRADIVMNTFDYGCVMQKITVQPMDAVDAPQWDLTTGTSIDQYVVTKPIVKQKLFTGITAWEIDITIPDFQLRTAFTSYEQMAAFIDAIYMAINNSLELQLEQYSEMAIANYIGEKIYAQTQTATQNGLHVIHLLQKFNSETGENLTATQALRNADFYKYASRQINLFVMRMSRMSRLFNLENYARFTPRDDLRITMLADFVTGADSYLSADTFHNDLVALPLYREIPYWQGSGQEYGFAETSLIDITTSDGHNVKQDGVVCLLNDREAIGMTLDNRRVRSSPPNGRGEYTNYFYKSDIQYYNDMSENGLVFTVTDSPVTAS